MAGIQVPDAQWLNGELKALIAQRLAADTQGAQRSNTGGWQSAHDFPEWDGAACETLVRFATEFALTAGFSSTCAAASGTFVMFPSWLMHSVRRFEGSRPRISIAFNFGV
ncbi:hypothetical protein AYK59_19645 [Pseudomonas synxantha]|uniref:putative 2OG-Fe(II) oxygenase n=1 Tax=Pseudomonas synxantha TaxID=47883 RepID=UPI00078B2CDD|nr:putative 2OG-Fe(II) oxygenase [Pseudomonas synxantha]AMS22228.1 hypothetical protein AYK59_19645 [Pseudomonas synxantha]